MQTLWQSNRMQTLWWTNSNFVKNKPKLCDEWTQTLWQMNANFVMNESKLCDEWMQSLWQTNANFLTNECNICDEQKNLCWDVQGVKKMQLKENQNMRFSAILFWLTWANQMSYRKSTTIWRKRMFSAFFRWLWIFSRTFVTKFAFLHLKVCVHLSQSLCSFITKFAFLHHKVCHKVCIHSFITKFASCLFIRLSQSLHSFISKFAANFVSNRGWTEFFNLYIDGPQRQKNETFEKIFPTSKRA